MSRAVSTGGWLRANPIDPRQGYQLITLPFLLTALIWLNEFILFCVSSALLLVFANIDPINCMFYLVISIYLTVRNIFYVNVIKLLLFKVLRYIQN